MPRLEGILERITFHSETDGYTVARVLPKDKPYQITIVGKLLGVQVGESVELEGRWVDHPEHGRQFEVERYRTVLPATIEGIRRYLGSGLIKGIGPVMARRIAETFGTYTLHVLDHEPLRLREVSGLGPKRVDRIMRAWEEQQQIKAIMLFLQDLEIAPGLAVRIYKQYGEQSLSVVQATPYRLADDVYGIGFLTADKIAQALGIPHDSPQRVGAGLRYTLSQAADEGHCYLPWDELAARGALLLGVDPAVVDATLGAIAITREVYIEALDGQRMVYLQPFYRAEHGLADRLHELLRAPSRIAPFFRAANWDRVFEFLADRRGMPLAEQQQEAVKMALTNKVSVLTGGPGTGKTTSLKTIILALQQRGEKFLLASPTGRAAKRLSEATGAEASTIHRLLEFSPIGGPHFSRNAENPLDAAMVVIDEASMLDVLLANNLFKAIPPDAHVLLVGDADQLPSVGPGRVLRDILDSMAVPSIHLNTIFRQAEGSGIVANAHRINAGDFPHLRGLGDFFFFPRPEPEPCAELVAELVAERIPRRFGLDPRRDVQVLTPTHRGPAGVASLNALLQTVLNPPLEGRAEHRFGASVFRLGDRVLQLRNNYDLEVYNGDIGVVAAIDPVEQLLTVRYDDVRDVAYDFGLLDELTLAYAISVHKAQGAEYPCIVLPLLTQHFTLLQRNLLYTAITRARQLVVLLGDRRAIAIAVKNNRVAERYTGLARHLKGRS
ncbi:MAG TPA: ATP-dependent RecD-like DNA helicase [Kouleothrix sp.]|uniref:SF1B family DNA helicase RecD2 n=1 Tax=Kouleothrix sp. TaxID=2779161 RepID=UPI002CF1D2B2|nr:ATP-dependent RecD-like DNA helicase [Kouleothrix sp.]HRC75014.1 ATP-dependent RecD-like DNA helicase [Kouleothrix sp.]